MGTHSVFTRKIAGSTPATPTKEMLRCPPSYVRLLVMYAMLLITLILKHRNHFITSTPIQDPGVSSASGLSAPHVAGD